ncbi:hypothetical protein [Streptomyces sp. NPDC088766]|uniref:hypothetical protein n=1 Tax=Streptomyces sp. NPDC088766 TaxID=3365893 RepID=UPI00382B2BFA
MPEHLRRPTAAGRGDPEENFHVRSLTVGRNATVRVPEPLPADHPATRRAAARDASVLRATGLPAEY